MASQGRPETPKGPHLIQSTLRSARHCRPLPFPSSPRPRQLPYNLSSNDHLTCSLQTSPCHNHKTHTWHSHYWPLAPHKTDTWGGIRCDSVSWLPPDSLWLCLGSLVITGVGHLDSTDTTSARSSAPARPGPGPGHSPGQGPRVFTFNLNVFKTETIFR